MPHRTLRNHNNSGETGAVEADGVREADVSLQQAVGATFAVTMQEEDDGPVLFGRPIFRKKNLIRVGGAVKGERAVEEAGFPGAGIGARRQDHGDCEKRKTKQQRETHECLQAKDCSTGREG